MQRSGSTKLQRGGLYRALVWTILGFLTLLLAVQAAGVFSGARYGAAGTTDFIEYWSAGRAWVAGGNPYDPELLLGIQQQAGWPHPGPLQMWNPPWLLVWMIPFVIVPFDWGTGLWALCNLTILLLSATRFWKWLAPPAWRMRIWMPWLAAFFFAPSWLVLGLGQASAIALLGVALFILFSKRGQPFLAGMAAALVIAKPHLVYLWVLVLVWEVLRKRQWKTLLGSAALLSASTLVLMFFRLSILTDYWVSLQSPPLYWATPTLGTLFRELFPGLPAQVQYLPPLVTGLSLLGLLLLSRVRVSAQDPSDAVLLLAVSVPTAAFGWSFDQVVLLGPFLAALLAVLAGKTNWMVRVCGVLGLAFYSGGHLFLNASGYDEASKVWLAWVLLATYLFTVRLRAR